MRAMVLLFPLVLAACGGSETAEGAGGDGGAGAGGSVPPPCPAGFTGIAAPGDPAPPQACIDCYLVAGRAACGTIGLDTEQGTLVRAWSDVCHVDNDGECGACFRAGMGEGETCLDPFGDTDARCYAGYSGDCRAAHDAVEACFAEVLAGCVP